MREHKKNKTQRAIEKLEKQVKKGNKEALSELREQKSTLSKLEDKEIEDSSIVFRKWSARQVDKPTKQMFQMLKVKPIAAFIPLLKVE